MYREHIAPVLCVAAIVNRSLVISGGEDSAVIVTSLVDGALVIVYVAVWTQVYSKEKCEK